MGKKSRKPVENTRSVENVKENYEMANVKSTGVDANVSLNLSLFQN